MRAIEARQLDGTPLLTPEAVVAFRAHAIDAGEEECLGYIDRDGDYRPLRNVAPEPTKMAFPPRGTIARLLAGKTIRALCHSHPNGLNAPSEQDMRQQLELQLPFVICASDAVECTSEPFAWGDQLLDDRDLVGRPFRHGVDDCYAIVRAWFWKERQVRLPEYPRNWEWWKPGTAGGKDLYTSYFADAGFHEIDRSEVVPGDCWLGALRSELPPSHAGVVLDAGLCLHHPSGGRAYDPMRLSKREPLARWAAHVTHWLRR